MGIDLALGRDAKVPVSPGGSAFARHCAVLAQSGSGKSFMMGRLIEELLIKTKASVVIFDPNSDYARLNEVNGKVWANAKCQPWFFDGEDQGSFREAWSKVSCVVSSNHNLPNAKRLAVDWGKLRIREGERNEHRSAKGRVHVLVPLFIL